MPVGADSLVILGRRGRPARAGQRATRRVEFVVTDQERSDLELVAKEMGHHVARVIRDAVNEFVADYRERPVFTRES